MHEIFSLVCRLFCGGAGGGGVGHDFSFLAITACSSLALLDFFGENYHPTSGYF